MAYFTRTRLNNIENIYIKLNFTKTFHFLNKFFMPMTFLFIHKFDTHNLNQNLNNSLNCFSHLALFFCPLLSCPISCFVLCLWHSPGLGLLSDLSLGLGVLPHSLVYTQGLAGSNLGLVLPFVVLLISVFASSCLSSASPSFSPFPHHHPSPFLTNLSLLERVVYKTDKTVLIYCTFWLEVV